jgi:DNA repair photolyase
MERALDRAASSAASVSPVVEFLRARVPVHFGGMSGPLQPAEGKLGVTHHFLCALKAHWYPTVISTRSPLIGSGKFGPLLCEMPVVVQFSMSTIDDRRAKLVEPLAPAPSQILGVMRALTDAGIKVTCRWQTFIPGFSPTPDEYVHAVADAGARQVSLEHIKIPTENSWNALLRRGAGPIKDVKQLYMRHGARRDGREFVLPAPEKLATVLTVRKECHRRGIAFGGADNEFQYLSDGDARCSGVDLIAKFGTTYRYTISHIIKTQIIRGQSEVVFLDEGFWRPKGAIDRFLNSKSRLIGRDGCERRGVDYFMRRKWNDVNGFESPSRYYGIRFVGDADPAGMRTYVVDPEVFGLIRG